jgi:peptidyl-dipeptidase Dcp
MGLPGLTINSCRNKPDRDMSNPFFSEYNTPFEVPPFEKIMAKHYLPAFEKGISENREEIEILIKSKQDPTFENTIEALDKSGDLLNRVSSVFLRQIKANTNDSLKSLEMEISPRLAAFRDEINLNHKLFARVKYVYDNQSRFNLNQEQKFLLENLYRSFVRNGANLNKQDQDTLKRINQQISVLTVKFSQNVLNETNNYRLIVDKDGLAGLPESLINSAAGVAEAGGYEGKWAFTTQRPSIFPFLQNSPNRDLRRQIFNAYISLGNNGNEFDNNKILSDLIRLRAERARLLGYKTHSDYVLEPRMAKKPENVFALLNSLWEKAIPVAKKEVIELQKIIEKEGGNFKLEPSDWWYYAEKLRKQKYDLNDSDLRPYFKLDNVREGAFICAEKLFGITFAPIEGCPLPHPEVEAFEVKDSAGVHIGVLYMDFYPRDSKQQGAWCETYRSHHIVENKAIAPVVTTVFNFTRPTGEVPSLLSMEEV